MAVETSLTGDVSSPSAVLCDGDIVPVSSVSFVSFIVLGVVLSSLCLVVVVSVKVESDSSLCSHIAVGFKCSTRLKGE